MTETNAKRKAANPKGSPSQTLPQLMPTRKAKAIPGPATKLPIPSATEISAYSLPISLFEFGCRDSTRLVVRLRMVGAKPEPKVDITRPSVMFSFLDVVYLD
jgi:hypothetical protein